MMNFNHTEYDIDSRLYDSAVLHCITINNINDEDDVLCKDLVRFVNELPKEIKEYLDKELSNGVKSTIRDMGVRLESRD